MMNTDRPLSPARLALQQQHAALIARHRAAIEALLPLMDYAGCLASLEGDDVVFTGATGRHALDLSVTDAARALAHWDGFASDARNGGRWARVRRLDREERAMGCQDCGEGLAEYGVATDFGFFCTGTCAETHRSELGE